MGDEYISMAKWGKDHWSTLAYLETVEVECGGFQVGFDGRMRQGRRNFRVMSQECPKPKRPSKCPRPQDAEPMGREDGTRLNDGTVVEGHDDWYCVQDIAMESLFTTGVDSVEPGSILHLSKRGWDVVNALRKHKAGGGNYASFAPADAGGKG